MYPRTGINLYRLRYFVTGLLAIVLLITFSAVITTMGSHGLLNSFTDSSTTADSGEDDPNIVTEGVYKVSDDVDRIMSAASKALYEACDSITNLSVRTGKATAHGSVATARFMSKNAISTAHGVGSAAMFTFHAPGTLLGYVADGHKVSAIIKPADEISSVPVINGATSAAAYARLSAQQQQEIANLEAAQVAANRNLGGSTVAGDPTHGGYPAKWDNIAQDNTIDSWGMYNRECVSYAAWKVYQTYGDMPYWGGVGNANQWVGDAKRASIPTGSVPQVHSVAISMAGYYGHAMWVEAVRGNMIYVSQYNYDLHGHYSEMWVDGSYFTYIYFK
jgi:surface antigen